MDGFWPSGLNYFLLFLLVLDLDMNQPINTQSLTYHVIYISTQNYDEHDALSGSWCLKIEIFYLRGGLGSNLARLLIFIFL